LASKAVFGWHADPRTAISTVIGLSQNGRRGVSSGRDASYDPNVGAWRDDGPGETMAVTRKDWNNQAPWPVTPDPKVG
jgi:hypothetical protein